MLGSDKTGNKTTAEMFGQMRAKMYSSNDKLWRLTIQLKLMDLNKVLDFYLNPKDLS